MVAIAIFCVVKFSAINNKPVLRVFNSGEYMDSDLIEKFEKENDCYVVYETFDSNE